MTPCTPEILPEIAAPRQAAGCDKCELCSQGSRIIWAEGYADAPLFVILDNPGAREDKLGQPFLCGTRQTLLTAAHKAGILPEQMYITYILKYRPLRKYDKPKARQNCMGYLQDQLEEVNPKLLLILGNTAIKSLLGDTAEVKNLRGAVHHFGEYKAVVSYHPLAVRRRPNMNKVFLSDLMLASSVIN
ncbi:MAG TPA: uracil-DNA glycosylase [Clostridiales bacterium]|nr:uracil-DNA glycosylase [Clostridiales bacterium]